VRWGAANGVEGLKVGAHRPDIMAALMDEAKKNNMGSTAHLQQTGVAQMNALTAARLGLQTVTHFYGHFEALLKDYVVQPWPVDQINDDEQMRFGQVARLWDKIHPPGSPEWKEYLQEHRKLNTTFDPTMTAYAAGRDLMRMRNADWHGRYTLPSLMDFYTPSRSNHGSYWFYWTLDDEIAWRNFYQVWFRLLNDYKKMGGRVTVSADAAFIYNTYGFGNIHEMELLQEAGFHPLEVIQAATYNAAMTMAEAGGKSIDRGVVRAGLLADMLIVDQNPLKNLKVLYGTGALKLNDQTGRPEWIGGVKYTIKDGIVYDAKKLLADVAAMVDKQKQGRRTTTSQ
jgi:imidazolonepropionase-like amidohydrolase